jgi:hypothetical protein
MYELPHSVIIVDGQQFDPLSISVGFELEHRVKPFLFWEHVLAAIYAAEADFAPGFDEKIELLDKAEEICPGFILLKEKRAGLLMSKNDPRGVELLKKVHKIRPVAGNLFALWALEGFSEESEHRFALEDQYTPAMVKHLINRTGVSYEFIIEGA